ncbi:hypothetical protein EMPS_00745 [Entomortierella parvispora]|uniref:FAD-binding domain-containing protein n=1 Tax=Entomortierella parvispora TaxID=205924 RepID=A0A9P3H1K5_9FUNG|nr:hypothetical protein EMPS_00745 [Entomortierella parvispora]
MSTVIPFLSGPSEDIPVLISGAGPTGLLTALLLTKMNIPCRIIERELCFSPLSKSVWTHSRTQEILHLIDPELLQQCMEQGELLPKYRHYFGGKMVLEARLLPKNESFFEMHLQLSQERTVRILEKGLEKASGGKMGIERGWELMDTKVVHASDMHASREDTVENKKHNNEDGFMSSTSWVETILRRTLTGTNHRTGESKLLDAVELSEEEEGKQYEYKVIKSQYLVGADGGRSVVRHKINMPFPGITRDYECMVFDGTVDTDILIDGACVSYFDGNGICVLPMGEKNRVQLMINTFNTLTTEQFKALRSETLTVETFQPILDAHVYPRRMKILTVNWLTYYRVHERNAKEYVFQDRIILAGDAAHIHSPAAGQGLNLDSYNEERPKMAETVIKLTATSFNEEFCLDTKLKRAILRFIIAIYPIIEPLIARKMAPKSMIYLRYHLNSLNKEHPTQKASQSGPGAAGQRAGDGFLIPFGHNLAGSNESTNFKSGQDGGSDHSDVNGFVVPATKDQNMIRLHDLMAGHPAAFQVLVFTDDLWKHQASAATALSQTMEHYLAHWRSQWRSPATSAASLPSPNGSTTDEVVKHPSRHHLFMVHTFTTLSGPTLALGKNALSNKMVGEGMAYTDVDGVLHRRYEVGKKTKWFMAPKADAESDGAIVVVRPDSYISFRVRGAVQKPSALTEIKLQHLKRQLIKGAYTEELNAIIELGKKMQIIGEHGMQLLDHIDLPLPPGAVADGRKTEDILQAARIALENWDQLVMVDPQSVVVHPPPPPPPARSTSEVSQASVEEIQTLAVKESRTATASTDSASEPEDSDSDVEFVQAPTSPLKAKPSVALSTDQKTGSSLDSLQVNNAEFASTLAPKLTLTPNKNSKVTQSGPTLPPRTSDWASEAAEALASVQIKKSETKKNEPLPTKKLEALPLKIEDTTESEAETLRRLEELEIKHALELSLAEAAPPTPAAEDEELRLTAEEPRFVMGDVVPKRSTKVIKRQARAPETTDGDTPAISKQASSRVARGGTKINTDLAASASASEAESEDLETPKASKAPRVLRGPQATDPDATRVSQQGPRPWVEEDAESVESTTESEDIHEDIHEELSGEAVIPETLGDEGEAKSSNEVDIPETWDQSQKSLLRVWDKSRSFGPRFLD